MNGRNPPEHPKTAGESPWVVRVVVRFLLEVHGGTQVDFARDAGFSVRTVSRCLNGAGASGPTLQKLAATAGMASWELDELLALARAREARREAGPRERAELLERSRRRQVPAALADALEVYVSGRIDQLRARRRPAAPGPLSRKQAETAWARLRLYPYPVRCDLIEEVADFQAWELAELLCDESLAAAPADPDQALELADLALRIAALSPADTGSRDRRVGYTWAHRGHALYAKGDLDGAEEALRTARRLWKKGAGAAGGALDEARLLGLEASLREERDRPNGQ